ncbi:polysaccharide export protein (plasmid) [Sphingomonas sp. FARSPH]|nr:polysaccharide export protein [Sphingomonas sp. FARSPH]
MRIRMLSAIVGSLILSACSSGDRLVGRPGMQVLQQTALPEPTRQDLILERRAYVIGPLDKLTVDVYGVEELTRSVQVDASGEIALPLIGTVTAAGKTPLELADMVSAKLKARYVRNPQVTVSVDTGAQTVAIDGQVNTPGLYPVVGRMTLMRAIASAKGLADFAQPSYVVVYRRVNNQEMAALYDLRAIRNGAYADPDIFANDIVYVGEDSKRRVFEKVISSGVLLAAPLVTLIR